jgi:GTP 3',8-cyclase
LDKGAGTGERPAMPAPADQLGRPLRDLRISLIDRCNLRCTYCMPAEVFGEDYAFLHRDELLSFAEIERVVRIFAEAGVRKIRLTGGEPLLRKGVEELVGRLAVLPSVEDLALTTNGLLLPPLAEKLAKAGLHRLTVSLDALDPTTFRRLSGQRGSVERVLEGIEAAARAGLPIKLNCVLRRGQNEGEIRPLAEYARAGGHTLRFIEFMDVGNHNRWKLDRVVPAAEVLQHLVPVAAFAPLPARYPGEVARRYRWADGAGEFGLITSVTQPFCSGCSRARLSADGQLYTCLFGNVGWDLRALLREGWDDARLTSHLTRIWTERTDRYSEERAGLLAAHKHIQKVEMSYIGG